MNTFVRIKELFTNPVEVFKDIKERPGFIKPILILLGIFIILMIAQGGIIKDMMIENIEVSLISEPNVEITDKMLNTMVMSGIVVGVIGAVVNPLFKGMLVHGIAILLGGHAKIKQTISLIVYSYFIVAIGQIIVTIMKLVTGNGYLNLSLAMFLSDFSPSNIWYIVLSTFDIFIVGYLFIGIIGIKTIHGLTIKKAAIAVLVPTVLYILMTVGPALGTIV